jgi:anti-sigma-K factor RskA
MSMKRKATRNRRAPGGCAEPGKLLVDYVDGGLPPAEAARVERHLTACDACRREVAALDRSLATAQSIWTAGADEKPPATALPREWRPWGIAAAAAGIAAVMMLMAGVYFATRPTEDGQIVADTTERTDSRGTQPSPDEAALDDLDIEAYIQRQEQSARLAASVQLLTAMPVDREDARRAERYLREAYGVE